MSVYLDVEAVRRKGVKEEVELKALPPTPQGKRRVGIFQRRSSEKGGSWEVAVDLTSWWPEEKGDTYGEGVYSGHEIFLIDEASLSECMLYGHSGRSPLPD